MVIFSCVVLRIYHALAFSSSAHIPLLAAASPRRCSKASFARRDFVRTVIAFSVGALPGGRVDDEAVAAEAAKNIFNIVIG